MKDASGTVEEILILVPGNAETGQASFAGRLNPDNGFPGDDPSCYLDCAIRGSDLERTIQSFSNLSSLPFGNDRQ